MTVCPRGVFDLDGAGKRVLLKYPERCLSCNAPLRRFLSNDLPRDREGTLLLPLSP